MSCSIAQDPRYLRFSVLTPSGTTHYNLRVRYFSYLKRDPQKLGIRWGAHRPRWTFYGRSTTISLVPSPARQVRASPQYLPLCFVVASGVFFTTASAMLAMPPPWIFSRRPSGNITPKATQTIEPSSIVNSKMPMYRTHTASVFPITARNFSSKHWDYYIIFPLLDTIRGRTAHSAYSKEVRLESIVQHNLVDTIV